MDRICAKCGLELQENDFFCPQCGAIYGEPIYEAPKVEEKPVPAEKKRGIRCFLIVGAITLVIVLVSLTLWNPFRSAETLPPTAPAATSTDPTVPTTWWPILPTETSPPVETVTDAEILEVYNQWFYSGRGDVSAYNVEHYGQYGGAYAVIVRDPARQGQYVYMDSVGDMLFYYDTAEYLWVYWNGDLYGMGRALEEAVLTYTNVREIYQLHRERNPGLYTLPSPNMQMPEIDEETEQYLKQRYAELILQHIENPDIDQLEIDIYGEYDGEYVLRVQSPYPMPDS